MRHPDAIGRITLTFDGRIFVTLFCFVFRVGQAIGTDSRIDAIAVDVPAAPYGAGLN
jgi:hypothetical protein